ncbi:LysR family transcriptional regulator [Verminephrobacter eiseniae]|uniref:LysR family transcriptional regulator n=1 Tax=Verminephrobacter eiseniae TaxID=364317 RepID=UPI002238648D|nr:LysR family transcriptional regulator [Verminephrobacter eiseniae]MCW5260542.1 LysR family transcriptional regulator [Verminephrobacter eiseniae]
MNITLKQLRVFCALYELRSFTAAARAAFVTQSAVSKLCAELESEVGQALFERSTRSVTPCEGAADFYTYAQQILSTVRAAERSMSSLRSLERGIVGVAASPMVMYGLLGDPLASYHRNYPGIKLDLYELSTDETITYVRHGKVDMGIVSLEVKDAELATRPIFRDFMYAVCTSDHPLAQEEKVSWSELAKYDHIGLHSAYNVRRSIDRICEQLHLDIHFKIEASMVTSVLGMVRSGLGITVVPGYICDFARHLGLVLVEIRGAPKYPVELWLVQRTATRPSLAASALLECVEQQLEKRQ